MNLRDQILSSQDDFKSETVEVPEWGGLKLVMRELSAADRAQVTIDDFEQVEVTGGWAMKPKFSPTASARLVVLSAHDENGARVFQDGDAEALAQRASSVIQRLADVARRLCGLAGVDFREVCEQVVKEIDDGTDPATIRLQVVEALAETDEAGKQAGKESSATQPAETSSPSPTG